MPETIEAREMQQRPAEQDSSSDEGRSSVPKSKKPKKPTPKFEVGSQVWLKMKMDDGEKACTMTVRERREIGKEPKLSYEYKLEDSSDESYENGKWIAERELESCNGT